MAKVLVTEAHRVEFVQESAAVEYSPAEARELAEDLLRAAIEAEVALEEFIAAGRRRVWQPVLDGEAVI